MSEFKQIQNLTNTGPKLGHIVSGAVGAYLGMKRKGGFSGSETRNKMRDREHEAQVNEVVNAKKHEREMAVSRQFEGYKASADSRIHNQELEKRRFEADTVHEFATRYPDVTEIKHGGTSIKFSKRGSSKSASGSTPSKPKDTQPKAKKSGKGKIK